MHSFLKANKNALKIQFCWKQKNYCICYQ